MTAQLCKSNKKYLVAYIKRIKLMAYTIYFSEVVIKIYVYILTYNFYMNEQIFLHVNVNKNEFYNLNLVGPRPI